MITINDCHGNKGKSPPEVRWSGS